jgi:hypothetical protein
MAQMLPEVYWVDYRSPNRFLGARVAKGDAIVSLMPHTLLYQSNIRANNYLQTYTDRQVFYDVTEQTGRFLDKYSGAPVLRTFDEVREGLSRYQRIWIVATPFTAFQSTNDATTLDFVTRNAKLVFESYQSRVYLWER